MPVHTSANRRTQPYLYHFNLLLRNGVQLGVGYAFTKGAKGNQPSVKLQGGKIGQLLGETLVVYHQPAAQMGEAQGERPLVDVFGMAPKGALRN